ncbi:MAG: efflux transporter periplasmic adaptor subunit [Opitutus sp.]|nr:efflux transporter periplasmic adaptor subunit [Opitutus sp.]
MSKKFAYAILSAVLAIVAVVVFVKKKQFAPPPPFEFPPEAVTTARAEAQEWERVTNAVGSLRADQGVTVPSEGQGAVRLIAFESGQKVQAGDALVELDTDVERAQLSSAQARAELTRLNLERARELWDRAALAKSEFDAADTAHKSATADVATLQANLRKKVVRAPFAGRTGIRLVNLGQFLDRGNPVVSLQSLDPIHADFSLPQQRLAEIRPGYAVRVTSDALPGRVFEGKITAINPEVDAATRTFRVQATFANPDESLSPGMFVSVQVVAPERTDVVAVPATAVYYQAFGDTVFVAREEKDAKTGQTMKRAEQRFVRLGEIRGDFVVIQSGVKAGEEVVTSGVFKLSNGTRLAVDNSLAPAVSLSPKPGNT